VSRAGEITRRQFYRHLKAMLDKADILLEILDARDPLSCRAPAVEALALAMEPPKRIVLVLNKIDLVPPEVVQAWLAYLRKDFPTIAFKASTQQQRGNLSAPGGAAVNQATEHGEVLTGSGAAGTDTLLQLIKNYSRSHDLKTAVTVGVVGYPNVGKSSVINSLKRSKAVSVSSTPGHTRSLQEVSLDSKVSLIDCPGIIFDDEAPADSAEEGADAGAGLLLRNCIRVEDIEDPETAVDAILKRCNPEKLMALYSIPSYASTGEFLTHMAAKRGKLGKGGVPDKANAARSVLQDWNSGRIPFFVLPPVPVGGSSAAEGVAAMEEEDGAAASHAKTSVGRKVAAAGAGAGSSAMASEEDMDSAAIVSGWSKVRLLPCLAGRAGVLWFAVLLPCWIECVVCLRAPHTLMSVHLALTYALGGC
jgi:nuclear GTP-binding protein